MINPQDPESEQSNIAAPSGAVSFSNTNDNTAFLNARQKQIIEVDRLTQKIAAMIVVTILVVPFILQLPYFDTMAKKIKVNRTSAGLPATWEEAETETLQDFQEAIAPFMIPTLILQSLRGFEMTFYEDDTFYSLSYFLERTGNINVTSTKWSIPIKKTQFKRLGTSSTRSISYLHPVSNPLSPPSARATKTQRFERYDQRTVLIETQTKVQDVPLADCFVVDERLLLQALGHQIRVSAYFRIRFTQDTMFRSVIEKQTSQEFLEYFQNYQAFIVAVATGRQAAWQPTMVASGEGGKHRVKKEIFPPFQAQKKRKFGTAIISVVTSPLRQALVAGKNLTKRLGIITQNLFRKQRFKDDLL